MIGILLSVELWFPMTRSFPRIPFLIGFPQALVPLVERSLCVALIISLLLTALVGRTRKFAFVAITALVLLIFFDQMRLQPWVYQYLLLLGVLTLHDQRSEVETATENTLCLLQLVIASLYFWSGLQKLNFAFAYEVLPEMLLPLRSVFLATDFPLGPLGILVASCEILMAFGLLFYRTRKVSVSLAVTMHLTILALLIAKSYNSVVWAWNVALIVITTVAFWGSDVSAWRTIIDWRRATLERKAASSIALMAAVLPILSFCGWWDMYLSGALYSGNTPIAAIKIDLAVYEKLPEKAKQNVFSTQGTGDQMLPLFEWSMSELNVPVYPEQRVLISVTREVCGMTPNNAQAELIVKERPAIFNGSYRITRLKCSEILR